MYFICQNISQIDKQLRDSLFEYVVRTLASDLLGGTASTSAADGVGAVVAGGGAIRLSSLASMPFLYDPHCQVFGDGPIQYLVEVSDLVFIAWEDTDTETIVVNPITRFHLDELAELSAEEAWTVLHLPATQVESIQFREIDDNELIGAYHRMNGLGLAAAPPPAA